MGVKASAAKFDDDHHRASVFAAFQAITRAEKCDMLGKDIFSKSTASIMARPTKMHSARRQSLGDSRRDVIDRLQTVHTV